jgi:hypothetical protein
VFETAEHDKHDLPDSGVEVAKLSVRVTSHMFLLSLLHILPGQTTKI